MNKMLIFNEFVKKVQSDKDYYTFGNPSQIGLIEDTMAYFGLDYRIESSAVSMHEKELNALQDFIIEQATDEQLSLMHEMTIGQKIVPTMNSISPVSGKVFVSMPMNKSKCEYVDEIRRGISEAIDASNNTAYFLDMDVHNDNIFNKMMQEIISCKFLVADLTSQNTGVYYEAGYAKALGKTVIFTCKDVDFENVHFDIKQTQIVIWKDADDLKMKLEKQIKKSSLSNII